jgi:uncharacterized Zn-finger protein
VHGCNAKFTTKRDLERHERTKHKRGEKLLCEHCGKKFSRDDNMRRHIKVKCPRKPADVKESIDDCIPTLKF